MQQEDLETTLNSKLSFSVIRQMSQTHSLTGCLAFLTISPFFCVSIWTFFTVFHLEFEKEAIYDGFMAHFCVLEGF